MEPKAEQLKRQIAALEQQLAKAEAVCLCKRCHKPDPSCQCTHPTTETWMTVEETVDFYIEQLVKAEAVIEASREVCKSREWHKGDGE